MHVCILSCTLTVLPMHFFSYRSVLGDLAQAILNTWRETLSKLFLQVLL